MELIDNLVGVSYTLQKFPATLLSNTLKATLKEKYGVNDFASFSKEASEDNVKNRFPEIYEYQNFFIMERLDGSYLLLDGFRRLLLYNDLPTFNISVRVYKESDLPQEKLLKLMLMLNHTKFVGGNGKYYDKGFNLLLYTLYGFQPNEMENLFEGYINQEEENVEGSYYYRWRGDDNKLENSHDRMILPKTIEDLQFLFALSKKKPVVNNLKFLGTVLFNARMRHPEVKFDVEEFLKLTNNDVIKKLEESKPSTHGAREVGTLKKLMEMYINAIKTMCGEDIEETYAEANERVKAIKAKLKKENKKLIALGSRLSRENKEEIVKFLWNKKKSPKLYCIALPDLEGKNLLKPDLYENITFTTLTLSSHLMSTNFHIDLTMEGNDYYFERAFNFKDFIINERNGTYHSRGKRSNLEVFVDLGEMTGQPVEIIDKRRE